MSSGPISDAWSYPGARSNRSSTPSHVRMRQPGVPSSLGQRPFQYLPDTFVGPSGSPASNLTSSLSGAICEPSIPPNSRHSRSPSLLNSSSYVSSNGWIPGPHSQPIPHATQQHPAYPAVSGMSSLSFGPQDIPATNINYDFITNRNPSPDSNSSGSSNFCGNTMFGGDQYPLHSSRHGGDDYSITNPETHSSSSSSSSEEERLRAQVQLLLRRVQELEANIPPPTASFLASWKKRTDIRKRLYCSPNRAGNTLCAWHDSRRERREFPPRHAPAGFLNCGCTTEEALFEESLARQGVGSYHPGESVRMDPALRNPLLKLLKKRYGYRDGDFERDPSTGQWVGGEGAEFWEQQARSGSVSRRNRVDTERR